MILIKKDEFKKLSFDDIPVNKFEFHKNEKILKVYVSGAWDGDKGLYLDEGHIVFKDWSNLTVLQYDNEAENPIVLKEHVFDIPHEMDFFEEEQDQVIFAGCSSKGPRWIEWTITDSDYYAEFNKYGGPPESYRASKTKV